MEVGWQWRVDDGDVRKGLSVAVTWRWGWIGCLGPAERPLGEWGPPQMGMGRSHRNSQMMARVSRRSGAGSGWSPEIVEWWPPSVGRRGPRRVEIHWGWSRRRTGDGSGPGWGVA